MFEKRHPHHSLLPAVVLLAAVCLFGHAGAAFGQDDREPGWYDRAELSFVGVDGNAENTTFSFANKLEHLWDNATFSFTASALRAESTSFTRAATGTPDQFELIETSDSELTAENLTLGLRYDREINERLYWHSGVDWVRNEFAGFDSRLVGIVGVGHRWWDDDSGHFRTDYGLTWTSQDDLIDNPAIDDSWIGVRLSWDYERKFGKNATYANLLVLDGNADETEDLRADMTNSLAVSMTEHLALKVSLRWLFDNLPAFEEIPLIDGAGIPTGGVVVSEVEDLDTFLTVALVIDF